MKLKPIINVILATCCLSAHAELMEVQFSNTQNEIIRVKPENNANLNPTSGLEFTLSGGLDRKFVVELLDASNSLVDTNSSDVITIDDRMQINDKEFYGKKVKLSYRPLQTSYTARFKLLDLTGAVINVEELKFNVDTTPPAVDGDIKFYKRSHGYGDVSNFDTLEARELTLEGITDSGSGLSSAYFTARLLGTDDEKEVKVVLDDTSGVASWLKPSSSTYKNLFYKNRSDYEIGFKVFDKAGNLTHVKRISSYNGLCGEIKVTNIWNPITKIWDKFTPGMKVYENPYKFRIGVLRSEHISTNTNGKFGYNWSPNATDETYAYRDLTAYIPNTRTYYTQFKDSGYCNSIYQSNAPAVLADDVEEGPKYKGLAYLLEGESSYINSTTVRRNKPYVVDKVKVTVEARSYEQSAVLSGLGSCIITPGDTSCIMDINYERTVGNGYAPYSLYVKSTNGKFSGHFTYLLTYWDMDAPTIENIAYDKEYVSFTVYDSDAVNDWRRSNWLPSVIEALAENKMTGQVTKLSLISKAETNYQNWDLKFGVDSLPEGEYRLDAYVKDTYSNERTVNITNDFSKDSTPPKLTFTVDGKELGDTLRGLENLRVNLDDPNDPRITQVQLVGGPSNDNVFLAWSKIENNNYRLEYPRLYPEIDFTNGYELRVTVDDSYGNSTTYSAKFAYYPANLIEVGKSSTLAVPRMLKLRNDSILGSIRSNVLRTDSGSIATGLQDVYFTLRSDSPYPVSFANEIIKPGETKLVKMDLGDTGKINSSITPLETATGEAYFMIDIPQLRSKFD